MTKNEHSPQKYLYTIGRNNRPYLILALPVFLLIGALAWPVRAAAPPVDRIDIPAMGLTADVRPVAGQWRESQPDYDPDTWTLQALGDQVGWLETGDYGGPGNTVLVGHYTVPPSGSPGAFYRLSRLTYGDVITIRRPDGTTWDYRVITSRVVDDQDMSVLSDSSDGRLTLIGCNGADTTRRRVVVAEPIGQVVCIPPGRSAASPCID
jgi:LPXTG-site transpeptidase (sortase) family protein